MARALGLKPETFLATGRQGLSRAFQKTSADAI